MHVSMWNSIKSYCVAMCVSDSRFTVEYHWILFKLWRNNIQAEDEVRHSPAPIGHVTGTEQRPLSRSTSVWVVLWPDRFLLDSHASCLFIFYFFLEGPELEVSGVGVSTISEPGPDKTDINRVFIERKPLERHGIFYFSMDLKRSLTSKVWYPFFGLRSQAVLGQKLGTAF